MYFRFNSMKLLIIFIKKVDNSDRSYLIHNTYRALHSNVVIDDDNHSVYQVKINDLV